MGGSRSHRESPDLAATGLTDRRAIWPSKYLQFFAHPPSLNGWTEESRRGSRSWTKKGLRERNSPMCTLSQNGYGDL